MRRVVLSGSGGCIGDFEYQKRRILTESDMYSHAARGEGGQGCEEYAQGPGTWSETIEQVRVRDRGCLQFWACSGLGRALS